MLSKNRLKFLKSLQSKKNRQEEQLFLVEGEKILLEVLQSDFVIDSLYCTESFAQANQKLLKSTGIAYELATENDLAQAGTLVSNRGGLAVLKMKPNQTLAPQTQKLTLVLDGIQDPGNLGTIIRIADWYGISQIICSEDTVELYNPKVISASMASFLRVALFYTNLVKYLTTHSQSAIYGALLEGKNIHQTQFASAGLLLMGNESKGIRANLLPFIQYPITIPRFGQAESLNVGVATAVILDNWQRNQSTKYE
ncbi:MAG: RNA methyltransferase [Microscillaceae bacterium]|jgi:TrmH family RNA methyltransferase|nr:RNA methyltransferase [Microscillaceae bacterium]